MAPDNTETHGKFAHWSIQICLILIVLLLAPTQALAQGSLIERQSPVQREDNTEVALPDYTNFLETVKNGEKGVLRGVYVPGVLALPVVQQPVGFPGYISLNNNELTQFGLAAEVGNVGLLAHNYLSGALFTNLAEGQEVRLIYGDGSVEYFIIDQVLQYQALQPYSVTSEFRDLDTDFTVTAEQLFREVYRGEKHVTFQTCIEANGISSWGRLFIIAHPKLFPYAQQQFIRENVLPLFY